MIDPQPLRAEGIVPTDMARAMIGTGYLSAADMETCMLAAASELRTKYDYLAAGACTELANAARVIRTQTEGA